MAPVEHPASKELCREKFEEFAAELGLCMDEIFMSSTGVPENPFEDGDTNCFYRAWLASWMACEAAKATAEPATHDPAPINKLGSDNESQPAASKDQLWLCQRLRSWPVGEIGKEAAAEVERLQRLLDARPPYYCKSCDCASCGNTRRSVEPPLEQRPLSATQRLHNICDALSEQMDESAFSREEWDRVDRQTVDLQNRNRELEAEVSSLREHLAEVNRLMSLNVAALEKLQSAQPQVAPHLREPPHCSTCACGLQVCDVCEGSGESGIAHADGTESSTSDPPCSACGGSGKRTSPPPGAIPHELLDEIAWQHPDSGKFRTALEQLRALMRSALTKSGEQP